MALRVSPRCAEKVRRGALVCLLCAALLLGGCGDFFEAEYVAVSTFEPARPALETAGEQTPVGSLEELRELLLGMVAEGETERRFVFDAAYPGDMSADLSTACWQVRTQDALCAYCVDNIAYDVARTLAGWEGSVSVRYSEAADDVESIVQLPYAADAWDVLRAAIGRGQKRLVLLIEHSAYSEEGMEQLVRELYLETPSLCPREPAVAVSLYTGAETQRLYELRFDYGMPDETLRAQKAALAALEPFAGIDTAALGEVERALLACTWLCEHTALREEGEASSIYDALVVGEADSLGFACAYSELCRSLALPCLTVFGQRDRAEHCWSLVELEGDWYHVDVSACAAEGLAAGFLMDDERAWNRYRWDYFAYPHCEGALEYAPPQP